MRTEQKISAGATRRAFTLIEIMVVVGIIVLLIALLVPAVSSARGSARKAATTTQMRGIALACESYYQMFRAYPGAVAERDYPATTSNFSDSQALVVSLSRAIFPSAAPPGGLSVASESIANSGGGGAFQVAIDANVTPRDYSENTGNVKPWRNYDAFLSPNTGDLSSATSLPVLDLPTFQDSAYGNDALPILYYRSDVKYDPQNVGTFLVGTQYTAGPASFYAASNDFLTKQSGSAAFTNSSISHLSVATGTAYLQDLVTQKVGGILTSRGSFVLISAGADRTYGKDPKGNVDDIIVAGGN